MEHVQPAHRESTKPAPEHNSVHHARRWRQQYQPEAPERQTATACLPTPAPYLGLTTRLVGCPCLSPCSVAQPPSHTHASDSGPLHQAFALPARPTPSRMPFRLQRAKPAQPTHSVCWARTKVRTACVTSATKAQSLAVVRLQGRVGSAPAGHSRPRSARRTARLALRIRIHLWAAPWPQSACVALATQAR